MLDQHLLESEKQQGLKVYSRANLEYKFCFLAPSNTCRSSPQEIDLCFAEVFLLKEVSGYYNLY